MNLEETKTKHFWGKKNLLYLFTVSRGGSVMGADDVDWVPHQIIFMLFTIEKTLQTRVQTKKGYS